MTFTLIGMPGCGKSCLGKIIASKLKLKFIDGDRLIEQKFGKKLFELINEFGMEGFRRIEEETLLSIKDDNAILAPGGSAVYYDSVMKHCKKLGKVIYLYVGFDQIEERLGDYSKRGVVLKEGQTLLDLYNERTKLYEKYADITLNCNGRAFSQYQTNALEVIKPYI